MTAPQIQSGPKRSRSKVPAITLTVLDRPRIGRPSRFSKQLTDTARVLYQAGATDEEVAFRLGISVRTIYYWQALHPEFLQAVLASKELADTRVERALYNRAVGYSYESEEVRILASGNAVVVPVVKHHPPDVEAAKFWLKNRRSKAWREKTEVGGEMHIHLTPLDLALL